MLACEGPVIVDVRVTRDENVVPMVAPGHGYTDVIGLTSNGHQKVLANLTCPSCGHQNPLSHKCCSDCGSKL